MNGMKETHTNLDKPKEQEFSRLKYDNKEINPNENMENIRKNVDARVENKLFSFTGNLDVAKRYLDKEYQYMTEYRKYSRKADELESLIQRKKEPEYRKSEVKKLRDKAEYYKKEGEKYHRWAKMELEG